MGANTAGIYGAQLYREDDEPRYRRAFSICIAVISLGVVLAIVRKVDEIFIRRRNGGKLPSESTQNDIAAYDELKPPAVSNAISSPVHIDSDRRPSLVLET
jgi:hypothetical protein